MARQKKTSNGYYRKTFMYDGKRYCVYGKDSDKLLDKVNKKKELYKLNIRQSTAWNQEFVNNIINTLQTFD